MTTSRALFGVRVRVCVCRIVIYESKHTHTLTHSHTRSNRPVRHDANSTTREAVFSVAVGKERWPRLVRRVLVRNDDLVVGIDLPVKGRAVDRMQRSAAQQSRLALDADDKALVRREKNNVADKRYQCNYIRERTLSRACADLRATFFLGKSIVIFKFLPTTCNACSLADDTVCEARSIMSGAKRTTQSRSLFEKMLRGLNRKPQFAEMPGAQLFTKRVEKMIADVAPPQNDASRCVRRRAPRLASVALTGRSCVVALFARGVVPSGAATLTTPTTTV